MLSVVFLMNALVVFSACKKTPDIDPPGYGEPFENIDKTGFPEAILSLEEYNALDDNAKENYSKSFEDRIDFVRWYQEAYRETGKAGSLASKKDYMKDVDKTGLKLSNVFTMPFSPYRKACR